MATISYSSPSSLFFNLVRTSTHSTTPPPSLSFPSFHFPRSVSLSHRYSSKPTKASRMVVNAVTEEEVGLVSEGGGEGIAQDPSEDTVSVPISPSDVLVMYFKAEGAMSDDAVPKVRERLEGQEGIFDLEVTNAEGVASIVLTKVTSVQATGVASQLVDTLQSSGFKLHTLSLSFQDEEDEIEDASIEFKSEED
ncbi:heavy metal transport/detoxification superfamily protein [Carex rostrata]